MSRGPNSMHTTDAPSCFLPTAFWEGTLDQCDRYICKSSKYVLVVTLLHVMICSVVSAATNARLISTFAVATAPRRVDALCSNLFDITFYHRLIRRRRLHIFCWIKYFTKCNSYFGHILLLNAYLWCIYQCHQWLLHGTARLLLACHQFYESLGVVMNLFRQDMKHGLPEIISNL